MARPHRHAGERTFPRWSRLPNLKLFIDGHNLTNEEAREHTSFLKDIAPLPGRSIRAGFAYEF